jgi:hypothetical protein
MRSYRTGDNERDMTPRESRSANPEMVCRSIEKDEVKTADLLVSIAVLLLVAVPIKESS